MEEVFYNTKLIKENLLYINSNSSLNSFQQNGTNDIQFSLYNPSDDSSPKSSSKSSPSSSPKYSPSSSPDFDKNETVYYDEISFLRNIRNLNRSISVKRN